MTNTTFDPPSYRNLVRMSKRKHILVEGPADKRPFRILLANHYGNADQIDIDSAEDLIGFSNHGNRERVEEICNTLAGTPYERKIVGLVDRERREFDIESTLSDRLGRHFQRGGLVWTRGHSIENYTFDHNVIVEALTSLCPSDFAHKAAIRFTCVLSDAIRLSCAVSMASQSALDAGLLTHLAALKNAITHDTLVVNDHHVAINEDALKVKLEQLLNVDESKSGLLLAAIKRYSDITSAAQLDASRWACHGHIGFGILWSVYAACLQRVCSDAGHDDPTKEAKRAFTNCEKTRWNTCCEVWIRRVADGQAEFPLQVLAWIGLDTPVPPHRAT